jgi:NDP-sugar pyrophosphorylase family protein
MKRRLTITLDSDILGRVDSIVDRRAIRSRSHAIETLLLESLGSGVKKAVILAGGRKNKKCVSLRNINGRSLLHYQIDHLKSHGISSFIICAGRFTKTIEDIFLDGSELGVSIQYLKEERVLGTAGAVRLAKRFVANQKFLVLHGDILTDFNLGRFMEFHRQEGLLATIAVVPRMAERKYGKVIMAGNKITEFIKDEGDKGISIVNAGVYIFDRDIFDYFPDKLPLYFEKDIFPALARRRHLAAYIFQGKWYELSRYKDYLYARKKWPEKK